MKHNFEVDKIKKPPGGYQIKSSGSLYIKISQAWLVLCPKILAITFEKIPDKHT
jgi:hypothetical protein